MENSRTSETPRWADFVPKIGGWEFRTGFIFIFREGTPGQDHGGDGGGEDHPTPGVRHRGGQPVRGL